MSNKDLYDLLKSSYKNQKEAKTDLADKYNYDDDLSTNKNKVVIDKATGKPKIISRGSKTVRDWADNALIAVGLGKHAKGQKELQRSVKKVNEKYNQKPDIYSHSQASLFAENIPQKDKDQVYTVNKAVGLGDIGKTISKNQHDIIVKNDIPSLLHFTQKNPNVKVLNSHNDVFGHNVIEKALKDHSLDNLLKENN